MTRFKELKRIEQAIKNKDRNELLWAKEYCEARLKNAHDIHPNKIAKQARFEWVKRYDEVLETINAKNELE